PTFAETLPGFQVQATFGWIAPAGVPKPVLDKLIAALNEVGKDPEVIKRLEGLSVLPSGLSGEAYAQQARDERIQIAP
ncbi:hypothetical protein JG654_20375, partial [Vibrio cholerae]|uniref:tripartite tricarboxylate transporter substrate-binding protein n=1 Tax=Vibrio cholerae TaxID=666 RepID=UPI001A23C357